MKSSGVITGVFETISLFLFSIGLLALLYSIFLYFHAEGEQEKTSTAKKIMIYAVAALVVAGLSFAVPRVIGGFISG